MRNKILTRIIITTLLCAFLTLSVGKVTRVSAVGTTAAIAGTAFILTGAVYLSYVALTQGEMVLPAAEDMHNWLGSIGRKVSQYPSGAAAYQDIYQGLLKDPTANVIDGVWTWTQDRIKSFVNDFSDTRIIDGIVQYDLEVDISALPLNGYDYAFTFENIPDVIRQQYASDTTFEALISNGWTITPYSQWNLAYYSSAAGHGALIPININYENVRNYFDGTYYKVQAYNGNTWIDLTGSSYLGYLAVRSDNAVRYLNPNISYLNYWGMSTSAQVYNVLSLQASYPLIGNAVIYNSVTDETTELVVPETTEIVKPSWVDPDNNNRPIIPWVPIPDIPTGVPTPPGYTGPPTWGFPLAELLDLLEELAEGLIKIDAIARLINEFAGQHGDNYYLEYNDGDTNYYTYYQPTVFDNDTEYVTYNIDISEQEDVIPVDLNTISLYTDNRYLDQIKQSAINGSSMLRDLAVFWFDVDPEVTYIVFGCCILILIGAFTGKLGHS